MIECLPVSKAAKYLEILIIIWQCFTAGMRFFSSGFHIVFQSNFGVGQYLFLVEINFSNS